jgi:hypothetical protein
VNHRRAIAMYRSLVSGSAGLIMGSPLVPYGDLTARVKPYARPLTRAWVI